MARVLLIASVILSAVPVIAGDHALTVYAGRVTEDHWFESLPPGVHFTGALILVTASSWTVKEAKEGALALEVEGRRRSISGIRTTWNFTWRW